MGGWDLPDLLIERGIFEEDFTQCYVAEGVFLVLPSAGSVVAFHDIKSDVSIQAGFLIGAPLKYDGVFFSPSHRTFS